MAKILIIDSDEKIRVLMEGALGIAGHSVLTATNGREGWALCKSGTFDLIILDAVLPEMSGVELVHHIRNYEKPLSEVPILVMMVKKSMKEFFTDFKSIEFMVKPIIPEELLSMVKKIFSMKDREL